MYKHDYSLTRMPRLSDDVSLQLTSLFLRLTNGYFGDISLGDDVLLADLPFLFSGASKTPIFAERLSQL
jgi:hypothetical protein